MNVVIGLFLALGIGANTAIFSVINAFMLEPLPYPDGERLVEIHNTYPGIGIDNAGSSIPDYLDRREQAEALEALALFTSDSYNLAASGTPERLLGVVATPSLFSTLGVSPLLGRPFDESEAVRGNDNAVVLTHNLWVNRFNADRGVVGSDVRLNGESYRVVGIMPGGFSFPKRDVALYVPFAFTPEQLSALALTRFLASLLFGIAVVDPLTYVLVPLLLAAIALAACTLPAWRATRISPVAALRHE